MTSLAEIRDAISSADEKFIRRQMDRCKHFTGVQNGSCQRGIVYKDVWEGKTLPCFTGNSFIQPNDKCEQRQFPTREEATATLKGLNKRTECLLDGKCPDCGTELIEYTTKEGKYAGHGSHVCPQCREVKLMI